MQILKKTSLFFLRAYQYIFSPDHNRIGMRSIYFGCRYVPSCSEYADTAIRQHGLFNGIIVSLKRIARCHPFTEGGYDPVPPRT
ncbi:MAG: membrane protein insertion efficiency factor YidD [Patescibacteria group bacterium]